MSWREKRVCTEEMLVTRFGHLRVWSLPLASRTPRDSNPESGLRPFATKSHLKAMTKRVVDMLIKSDKVVIFSKTGCHQSQAAKNLFDDLRHKYTAIELDRREDGHFIQCHLGQMTGSSIMPRIFIVGKCIGGTVELVELHRCGSLLRLLKQDF